MTTRSRANFEGRSSRYANYGANSEYDQLRQAFHEPVLKWQRKVENPSHVKTFKVPLWVNTEVQAEFENQPSPVHSPAPDTIQTEALDDSQANISQTISENTIPTEIPKVVINSEEQIASQPEASDEKVEAIEDKTNQNAQASEITDKQISEPKELPANDQPININTENEAIMQTNIPAITNEVDMSSESKLAEKTAEISLQEDNKMDIDTEPTQEAYHDDKMNIDIEQPKDISEADKMDIDEITSPTETKEIVIQAQNESAQGDEMDIDPTPVTSQVENISNDIPSGQESANISQIASEKPLSEQQEFQTIKTLEASQNDKMDIDEEPKTQIIKSPEVPQVDKMDTDEQPESQIEKASEIPQSGKMDIDEESVSQSQVTPEISQSDKMETDEKHKPETQAQPTGEHSTSNQELTPTLELKPQNDQQLEHSTQSAEKTAQPNIQADKVELQNNLPFTSTDQVKDTQEPSEPAQKSNEPEPESEKLAESTLQATESLLGDIGTFPQPEPIDFSGTTSAQRGSNESSNESNILSVPQTESTQESQKELEQTNPEKKSEASNPSSIETKEADGQTSESGITDKHDSQIAGIASSIKQESAPENSKAPLLGLVSDYQSSSPTSEPETAQAIEKVDVPSESAETAFQSSTIDKPLATNNYKVESIEPTSISSIIDPISTSEPSIPTQQEQSIVTELANQDQSSPEKQSRQENTNQVEFNSQPPQNQN